MLLLQQITGIEPASPAWEAGVMGYGVYLALSKSLDAGKSRFLVYLSLSVFMESGVKVVSIFPFYLVGSQMGEKWLPNRGSSNIVSTVHFEYLSNFFIKSCKSCIVMLRINLLF